MTENLKFSHLVVNADAKWLNDTSEMVRIQMFGLPYVPSEGKSALGFRVGNLWLGEQAVELLLARRLLGMDEYREWCERYVDGERGLVALAFEVDDLHAIYDRYCWNGLTEPLRVWKHLGQGHYVEELFSASSQLPFFKGAPFQLRFVQRKTGEEARRDIAKITIPNAYENGIEGIESIRIRAPFTHDDRQLIEILFPSAQRKRTMYTIDIDNGNEKLWFEWGKDIVEMEVDVWLKGRMNGLRGESTLRIHNVTFHARGVPFEPEL